MADPFSNGKAIYKLPKSGKSWTVRTDAAVEGPNYPGDSLAWIHDEETENPVCGHVLELEKLREWTGKRIGDEAPFCPVCAEHETSKRMTSRLVREDGDFARKTPAPIPKIELKLQGSERRISSLSNNGIKSIPTASTIAPGDSAGMYIVEQWGKIWRYDLTSETRRLFLDVTEDILKLDPLKKKWKGMDDERGLLGLAFHPKFSDENSADSFYGVFYVVHSSKLKKPGNWNKGGTGLPFEHRSKLSRLRATGKDGRINIESPDPENTLGTRVTLLKTDQPEMNHNGGTIIFGPPTEDSRSGIGYLYYAIGDGGGANDEHGDLVDQGDKESYLGNAQDGRNHSGKILRIDVNLPYYGYMMETVVRETTGRIKYLGESLYLIPDENGKQRPESSLMGTENYSSSSFEPEIFAYGLRNPWKFSFDEESDRMFIADVGQSKFEEINIIDHPDPDETKMHNFGWRALEGGLEFRKENVFNHSLLRRMGGYKNATPPKMEYAREGKYPYAVIGGYVYRGRDISTLKGAYVFGDYNGIVFFGSETSKGEWAMKELLSSVKTYEEKGSNDVVRITSFATDARGELYLFKVNFTKNKSGLYRLIAGDLSESEVDEILLSAERAAETGGTATGIRGTYEITRESETESGRSLPRMHVSVYTKSGYYKTLSMSDAWEGSFDISRSKAYSAFAFSSNKNSLTTRTIGELSQTGPWNKPTAEIPYDGNRPPLHGIGHSNPQHGIIEFPGGLPIYHSITHELVGGIGVSGDLVDVDEEIALKGLPEKYRTPQNIRIDVVSKGSFRYTKNPNV